MKIKKVSALAVKDSRGSGTIQVVVRTLKGKFVTSAPSGKSKGKYEIKPYSPTLLHDIKIINNLDINKLELEGFGDLVKVEGLVGGGLGANSLFALESSLLKGLALEDGKELWEFLGGGRKRIRSVGNAIGGGLHSRGVGRKKPDFQEFLFIADCKNFKKMVGLNEKAYRLAGKLLGSRKRNDEGAWETGLSNEEVLGVMGKVRNELRKKGMKVDIGLDVASSGFYKKGKYVYKNSAKVLSKKEQIDYLIKLINKYNIFYVEDGLEEGDFSGFGELKRKVGKCLIVGDDLIVTNVSRLKKAVGAVSGVIVKPNQTGSLLKVKEVVDICNGKGIKTVMSHRSGETLDNTIADLGAGFGCDFIKTGIYGSVRRAKLKRLVRIEGKLR